MSHLPVLPPFRYKSQFEEYQYHCSLPRYYIPSIVLYFFDCYQFELAVPYLEFPSKSIIFPYQECINFILLESWPIFSLKNLSMHFYVWKFSEILELLRSF